MGRRRLGAVLPVLAAELATLPILVVATYRDPDAAGEAALVDALAALARLPAVDRITLRGWTASTCDG